MARTALVGVSGALVLLALYLGLLWAPPDAYMGEVQRALYFHVPTSILAMVAFLVLFIASIAYLLRRGEAWDDLAYASAEVGLVLTSLALVTGSLWARAVWGVFWTWSPRLTLTLVMWFLYVGYLMVRAYVPRPEQGARYGAVLGIVGFLNVPLVYWSVQWWRDIHPQQVVGPEAEQGALDPEMRVALYLALLAFTLMVGVLLWTRYRLRRTERVLLALRGQMDQG